MKHEKLQASSQMALQKQIEEYYKLYPIAGYGTHQGAITPPCKCICHTHPGVRHVKACCDGTFKWTVFMYREESCD